MFYLYLQNNQFSGSIPSEIGNMIDVEYLHMDQNQLTGPLPTEVGGLVKLRELFVNGNSISGTVPVSYSSLTNLGMYLSLISIASYISSYIGMHCVL